MVDKAMLRPQRLDKLLYVPLPEKQDREQILRVATRKTALDPSVDLKSISDRSQCPFDLTAIDVKGLAELIFLRL